MGLSAQPMSTTTDFPTPFNGHQVDVAPTPPSITSPSSPNHSCGIDKSSLESQSPIFGNGEQRVKRGDWPWLVAIYQMDRLGTNFACGGNLISKKAVLTAAHCVKSGSRSHQSHEILLYFGHYNRSDWNEIGSMRSRVAEIHIHPDYRKQMNALAKDADLAVLIAKEPITFNEFIRPVCLWSAERSNEDDTVDEIGAIVGWGRNAFNRLASAYPRKVELPIVDVNVCMAASKRLAGALSNRTFCAGTRDGNGDASICHGDSGKQHACILTIY